MSLFIYGNKYIFSCSSITLKMSTDSDMLVFFNYILIILHTRKHNLALITWTKTTKPNQVYQSYSNTVSRSKFLKEKKKTQRNWQFLQESIIWKSITQSRRSTFLGVDKISLQSFVGYSTETTTSALPLSPSFSDLACDETKTKEFISPKESHIEKAKFQRRRSLPKPGFIENLGCWAKLSFSVWCTSERCGLEVIGPYRSDSISEEEEEEGGGPDEEDNDDIACGLPELRHRTGSGSEFPIGKFWNK